MQDVQTLLPKGSIVDRYMIESILGKGGFGAVYLVHDTRVKGNQFALKEVIDPKKQDRVHVLFEGEVLKRLDHAGFPRVYRVFEDAPHARVYLLMDYVEGPNLDRLRRLQPESRFALPDMLRLMAPVVEAVMYLQSQRPPIIHRDIKPSNIIIPPTGDGPVLVDFGLAKEYDQDATTTAVRRLSPNYSAPEQYSQGTNPRTDIYGMAATFYTLLTGTPPVDAFERISHMANHGTDPLEPVTRFVPNIPPSVAEAIHRAMALASDERFPTMEAFWQALQPQAFPVPSPASSVVVTSETVQPVALLASAMTSPNVGMHQHDQKQRPVKRRILLPLFTLLALVAMLVGLLFGISFFSRDNPFHSVTSAGTTTPRQHSSSTHTAMPTTPSSASATRIPASTATVPATSSPSATQKPTPAPGYPNLDKQYIGSIHNASANIDGTMTLANVRQNGTTIGGVLTLTNGLQGTASFTGTVSSNNTLRFEVAPYAQYLPLLFQGHVAPDGSLSGTYCSVQGNQCNYAAGGYGTWKVSPPSPSSQIPSWNDESRV